MISLVISSAKYCKDNNFASSCNKQFIRPQNRKRMADYRIYILAVALIVEVCSDARCDYCEKSLLDCSICFSNCTNFVFNSCSDENGPISQSICIQNCCTKRPAPQVFNNEYMMECIETNTAKSLFEGIGYYAILCGGCVAMFLLLILVARAIYQRFKQQPLRLGRRVIPSISSFHSFGGQPPSILQIKMKEYPQNYKQIVDDQSNTCCICLDGQINALTRCGHVFHLNCLGSWGSRKNVCPLCNYKDIHEAKYFCGKCKKQKGVLDFRRLNLLQIERINLERCGNCGA